MYPILSFETSVFIKLQGVTNEDAVFLLTTITGSEVLQYFLNEILCFVIL
jgi:hypothetical protein